MKALITGISGQDGSYLAEFLLTKGYTVYGLVRRSPETMPNLRNVLDRIEFLYGDMRDGNSLASAIQRAWPDEIYNLAAQPFVPPSWVAPAGTLDINAGGLARILSLTERIKPDARVYQASSSEMFGNIPGALDESSAMHPTSPYGVSKLAAHHLVETYRLKGMKVVSGILFNHESPRRGAEMVTMKIARHVARFAQGIREPLKLGNILSRRDWGFAGDYVEAMWLMMQHEPMVDCVVGMGQSHSVEQFLDACLAEVGIAPEEFKKEFLVIDSRLQRTADNQCLLADATKASRELGWKPKMTFGEMVAIMVRSEIDKV